MINTLFLPELRAMLAEHNEFELREFCTALHPARTAEFMEGLDASESWQVLQYADPAIREQLFSYLGHDKQLTIIVGESRPQVAEVIANLPADERVDLLHDTPEEVVEELLPLLPADERREYLRLREYHEDSAGSMMTTEVAMLEEDLSVRDALSELSREGEHLETIYYIYVVDADLHLKGVVSARQLVSALGKPDTKLGSLMETDLVVVNAMEDRDEVTNKVAKYDLLAIPVVDNQRRLVGVITHDDVIDAVRQEATEDAQQLAGVAPLDEGYLRTSLLTLVYKRGIWLTILFVTAMFTATALNHYEHRLDKFSWLVMFIPLIMSSGGNSGNQSATLVITALTSGDVQLRDWRRVISRDVLVGFMLGVVLSVLGALVSLIMTWSDPDANKHLLWPLVVPLTLVLVVTCGSVAGSVLPLVFKRLGLDPALMSNPFVAGLSDILAIVIYMSVSMLLLDWM